MSTRAARVLKYVTVANSKGVPIYDELYVVSDLHMGGASGFQIFRLGNELAAFIRMLSATAGGRKIALLVNGDMVDFLAEPGWKYFDPDGAVEKLDRMMNDPAFSPAWAALREFIRSQNRQLIINLGNHDLELALPWVREYLLDALADGDDAARGRIRTVFDGSGFACKVGEKRILCLHGNEVDTWNVADYEAIRRIGRDFVQGHGAEPWAPNAGTKLVIDVMNQMKQKYAFVDLLKPEAQAVVPVLLALDRTKVSQLQGIALVASRLGWDQVRRATGLLTTETGEPAAAAAAAAAAPISTGAFTTASMRSRKAEAEALLRSAEESFRSGTTAMQLVQDAGSQQLGVFDAALAWVRGAPMEETLYAALKDLVRDRSFDRHEPDETFVRIDELVGTQFNHVITGHTHMEKILGRRNGAGTYFNTGSWVPRIRLTPDVLASATTFAPVLNALRDGRTVAALEAIPGLVTSRPVVARITPDNAESEVLRQVRMNGNQAELTEVDE